MRTGIKPYPACRYAHGPLDALIELATREDLAPADVREVTVGLSDAAVDLIGRPEERKRRPRSVVDAQFSMPFLAAAALHRRALTWDDYGLVGDPSVTELTGRVRVVADDEANRRFPDEWLAVIEVTATDGRTWVERRSGARGEPESPLSWAEVRAKFLGLAEPILGGAQAGALADLVRGIEDVTDLAVVGALLRPSQASGAGAVETARIGSG
jgi:2-methylcitrate dehydratase PrpD